jgi:long-chain acyl-CoA synthetase
MVLDAAGRHSGVALDYPEADGRRRTISYPELGAIGREIARGLMALGIRRGEPVAILATTRAEWTLVDCGALCAGAVVVPVYPTNSPEECAHVLGHSHARLVFCEDAIQAAKVEKIRALCPDLEHVVLIEGEAEGAIALAELRRRSAEVTPQALADRLAGVGGEDLATLVYTSGTTGPPKGCMLTHANLLATTRMYGELLQLNPSHVLFQFLPLAHVLARVAQLVALDAGARISFAGPDTSRLLEELATVRPTHFPAVPRVYEKLHAAIVGMVEDGSAPRRALFGWALAQGTRVRTAERIGARVPRRARAARALADRLVLGHVRGVFGGRLQLALVGAAPVAPELLEFFDACGVLVLEGYGMSESCAAATLNTPGALRYGTVGRPLPRTDVAIAEDGEILLHGPHVFAGYHRDRAATNRALSDGWLHTGDLGTLSADGFLSVTGRKKELIITSSGKNIAPAVIENALRETRWISEAVVYGDGRPYLVAMVTLDHDETAKLAARLQIPTDAVAVAHDTRVRDEVQHAFDDVNAKLARIEQVKRFAILDHDLTQARGELTPTLKVKRELVYERYAELFAALYREGEEVLAAANGEARRG